MSLQQACKQICIHPRTIAAPTWPADAQVMCRCYTAISNKYPIIPVLFSANVQGRDASILDLYIWSGSGAAHQGRPSLFATLRAHQLSEVHRTTGTGTPLLPNSTTRTSPRDVLCVGRLEEPAYVTRRVDICTVCFNIPSCISNSLHCTFARHAAGPRWAPSASPAWP
jgi:hypothetical protein